MSDKLPVRAQMESPWPAKLKALHVKEVLLIEKHELSYKQVVSLVANMNYRYKGRLLYRADGNKDTDTIVTCLFRGRPSATKDVKLSKAVKRRIERVEATKEIVTSSPEARSRIVASKYEAAMAIIEALHMDGSVSVYRAHDKAHYESIMEDTAKNFSIVQLQTFLYTPSLTKKRDCSWKDESAFKQE